MRERLLTAFDHIWIDNLNGGGLFKGSRGPDGKPDRSAFEYVGRREITGITVPTAITCLVKTGQPTTQARVSYRNLWGQGHEKRQRLSDDAGLATADLAQCYQPLATQEAARFVLLPGGTESEYLSWLAMDEIFIQQFPGFTTARDADLISIDREPLRERMQRYFDPKYSKEELATQVPALMQDTNRYKAEATRRELLQTSHYRDDRLVRVSWVCQPFCVNSR